MSSSLRDDVLRRYNLPLLEAYLRVVNPQASLDKLIKTMAMPEGGTDADVFNARYLKRLAVHPAHQTFEANFEVTGQGLPENVRRGSDEVNNDALLLFLLLSIEASPQRTREQKNELYIDFMHGCFIRR